LAGFRRMDGYAGLVPRRQLDFADPLALRVAGVGYRAESIADDGAIRWAAVADPVPPIRLVTRAIVDRGGAFPAEAGAVDAALVEQPLDLPAGRPGEIGGAVERPGHFAVTVQTDARQLLVINESFDSAWQCRIDGRPAPVLRVNRDFLGVVVEPGRQAVMLDFRPFSLVLGRAGSTLGLGLWCAQWVVAAWWASRSVVDRRAAGRADSRQLVAADSPTA
jgi:hypothetical protein